MVDILYLCFEGPRASTSIYGAKHVEMLEGESQTQADQFIRVPPADPEAAAADWLE